MNIYKSFIIRIVAVLFLAGTIVAEILINRSIDNKLLVLEEYEKAIEAEFKAINKDLRLADLIGLNKGSIDLILGAPFASSDSDEWRTCFYYKTSLFFQTEGTLEIGFDKNEDMDNPQNAFYARWTLNASIANMDQELSYRKVLMELTELYGEPCESEDDGSTCYNEWFDTLYESDLDSAIDYNYEMQNARIEEISLGYYRNGCQSKMNSEEYNYIDLLLAEYIGW